MGASNEERNMRAGKTLQNNFFSMEIISWPIYFARIHTEEALWQYDSL